jgi:hypothetical protein
LFGEIVVVFFILLDIAFYGIDQLCGVWDGRCWLRGVSVKAFRLMEFYKNRREADTMVLTYEVIPEMDLEQLLMVSRAL